MIAIYMTDGAYCALPPRAPIHRLHGLIKQTQTHVILVHHLTKEKFTGDFEIWNVDTLMLHNYCKSAKYFEERMATSSSEDSLAYVIFTSGSTGLPKAVS